MNVRNVTHSLGTLHVVAYRPDANKKSEDINKLDAKIY